MTDPGIREPAGPNPAMPDSGGPDRGLREPRPMIERIGLALIALVVVAIFGVIAAIGALMTAWAGGRTLLRG